MRNLTGGCNAFHAEVTDRTFRTGDVDRMWALGTPSHDAHDWYARA